MQFGRVWQRRPWRTGRPDPQDPRREAILADARARDYRRTFATPEGRRVLRDLIEAYNVLAPAGIDTPPHQLAMREGARAVVLRILGMIGWSARDMASLSETGTLPPGRTPPAGDGLSTGVPSHDG